MEMFRWIIKNIFGIIFLPVAILTRVLSPVLTIRVGSIIGDRIGHFAFELEMYLCEKDHNLHRRKLDIFFISTSVVNKQLKKMWGRKVLIVPKFLILPLCSANKMIPGYKKHLVPLCSYKHSDPLGLLNNHTPHLNFTAEEEKKGMNEIKKLGFSREDKIICFFARDSAFLDDLYGLGYCSYHDYRDANIQNYNDMASEFAEVGYAMIRYGSVVKKKLETSHPKVIDYASKGRSEFLDIYLIARSKFFVSTNSGPCALATIFRVPNAFANVAPMLGSLGVSRDDDLYIFKKYWLKSENRFLSIDEILTSGAGLYFETQNYTNSGIDLIENTPTEILDLVIEMELRIDGKWKVKTEEEILQKKYRQLLIKNNVNPSKMPRICTAFLINNQYLLS